jgi:5'(3')-deoxyribonucleotidase
MPLEEARKLAVEVDNETYEIKQKHLESYNLIRQDVIEELREISCRFIKQYLKEQLLEGK